MAQFEATVRLFDVVETDGPAARRSVEERLRGAGFTRWQIVAIGAQGSMSSPARTRPPRRPARRETATYSGGLLVAAVVAWALWFLWLLAG